MSAELYVCSEVPPLSWREFTTTHPLGSIALDGYVSGEPLYDPVGPYWNANHHEDVDRFATLSTSQQIAMNIRMGADKAFSVDGEFSPNVFVNDCDQDVCAAWYLLHNVRQALKPTPALNRFISVAGTLDATAGAFPYDPDMQIMKELAWVFEPYTSFRASGEMANKDDTQYESVIWFVESRIRKHVAGRGKEIPLDTRYSVIGGGDGWKMITEEGEQGRIGALNDGIDAYVSVQELPNGRWRHTLGRRSHFIAFPIPVYLERFNLAEGISPEDEDRWGGSPVTAGSPRVGASQLSPEQVTDIINEPITEDELKTLGR